MSESGGGGAIEIGGPGGPSWGTGGAMEGGGGIEVVGIPCNLNSLI